MLDALHHAAHTARSRTLENAKENLQQAGLDKDLPFSDALRAVLEVLPISRALGALDVSQACEASASDFEVLENLRRLMFAERVPKPKQLSLLEL